MFFIYTVELFVSRLATLAQLYNMKKQRDEVQTQRFTNENSVETISLKSDTSSISNSALSDAIIFGKAGSRKKIPQNTGLFHCLLFIAEAFYTNSVTDISE